MFSRTNNKNFHFSQTNQNLTRMVLRTTNRENIFIQEILTVSTRISCILNKILKLKGLDSGSRIVRIFSK